MAETKTTISELTAATAVAAGDLLFVSQQSGSAYVSKKATVGQLSSAIGLGNYSLTSHVHGSITSAGALSADITIANGDKLVVTDASGANKVARASVAFDGSTATQFLSKKGTWETPSLTGYVSKAELKTALQSVGQIPGGDGANLENAIAKFNALFAALSALTD